ncbi:MAG: extracellular solute-binding protein [Paraburkholderia sp.]|jgi:microcin C transport system substrate-binding protein|uniref:extracellular solute-binding protein n=1 Tax=Burkholderiaceae TaxID=119060 RepID=UPI0010F8392A|nr:extracellular solute-binding protein [Burkholderia sp. 4M9327F10]
MKLAMFRLPHAVPARLDAPAVSPSAWLRRILPRRAAVAALLCALTLLPALPVLATPSIAQFGEPRYPAGFTHFDYANPEAPTDGALSFANYNALQSYDSLNPFLLRGAPAPDILNLMFDTLMQRSWDEPASEYPLIADDVQVRADLTSATFHINPAARFSNGERITADDVKYSFDVLTSQKASPLFNSQFAIIKSATVLDASTIRFDFNHAERDAPLIAGDLPVFSPKWGMRPDGTRPPFDQIANVPPVASGPYLIERRSNDKTITYRRNPAYWAADLPSRRGMFRFERVTFQLFLDNFGPLEAFKAGNIDVNIEGSATIWARRYVGQKFRNGELKQGTFPNGPPYMQGILINVRRPMLQDVRVRHALTLAFDYDWMNRMMFYDQYRRSTSYFDPDTFGARGMPGPKELALLEPYRASLPPAVFGPMLTQPSTLPPNSLRGNLRAARDLLAKAGWHYRDGALRDANGTAMRIEVLDDEPGMDRLLLPYMQALNTLGIQTEWREVDSALYQQRLDSFDFDMTTGGYLPIAVPGVELLRRFGSAAAAEVGSENYVGVHSKVVDALIQAALSAQTLDDLETATRALDRVLINAYYVVPEFYAPNARIAYKTTFGWPAVLPKSYRDTDWVIDYWYVKPHGAVTAAASAAPGPAAH